MLRLADYLAPWEQAAASLCEGSSVLMYAPLYYADDRFAVETLKTLEGATCVRLSLGHYVAAGKLEYARLWDATKRQARYSSDNGTC